MPTQPIEQVSQESEQSADDLAKEMLIRLGGWTIPSDPLPDYAFDAGCTVKKIVKKIIRVPIDDQQPVVKIAKKVVRVVVDDQPVKKIVKRVVRTPMPEQLSTDGRPWWCPNEPIWCMTCQRFVVLKTNGECPSCHFLLAGPDVVPF